MARSQPMREDVIWLSKVSANDRRCYKCDVFSHWLRTCSDRDREQGQENLSINTQIAWCRHQMETFSMLLAICAGNSPVTGESPTQRPVTRIFDVYFDLRLNKWLSKQSWGWWFETLSCPLWRHCNVAHIIGTVYKSHIYLTPHERLPFI